ncbi:hypothetical protein [Flavihumibacter petaseus]|uniref:Polyketide cyclase/dehydrase n=1 Tax=Flavihumibacter petaseus NBRC 106054 TaxID=1220578 RepID=A0A0E9N1A3_9BACT|nr:hypothetical protein [Flavihumibacter petaseus]GAO43639.1 hypothetical protein FPE01S_02_07450 [Flavihumibacter petaseus NBRC 106054]
MKILKLAFWSILFFSLLLLVFSLLIPSHVRISRAIDIQAGKAQVLPLISTNDGWTKWNAYAQDSSGKFRFEIRSVSDSLVEADWTAGNKTYPSNLALYGLKSGTLTVQWYVDFKLSWYPWEKFGSILYDNQMGPVMEQSLRQLKALAEK